MSLFSVRPRVSDLVFQLYSRPLHPEFFEILAVRALQRDDCQLTLRITRSGHLITWSRGNLVLSELADLQQELPDAGRLLSFRMRGEHSGVWSPAGDIRYQMSFQVETLAPEIFVHVHDEILADGGRGGLLHHFAPHQRLALSPLGSIAVDQRPGCLFLTTFHTFPEEHTVVKSQTLIENR